MKVTDEMVARVRGAGFMDKRTKDVRWALESALTDIPEPLPGPFVTTESVALRELHYLVDELEGEQDAGVIWNKVNDRIGKLLQSTLAAPAVEPLSEYEESVVSGAERTGNKSYIRILARIVRKRVPKPAPKPRTADDIAKEIHECLARGLTGFAQIHVNELLALAKKGEK